MDSGDASSGLCAYMAGPLLAKLSPWLPVSPFLKDKSKSHAARPSLLLCCFRDGHRWWTPERSTERNCLQVRALLGYFSTPLAVAYGLALKQGGFFFLVPPVWWPHRRFCLNAWFLVGGIVLGRTRRCDLDGGVVPGGRL